jgi:hypothetical protein
LALSPTVLSADGISYIPNTAVACPILITSSNLKLMPLQDGYNHWMFNGLYQNWWDISAMAVFKQCNTHYCAITKCFFINIIKSLSSKQQRLPRCFNEQFPFSLKM